jgi:hypothetical protein
MKYDLNRERAENFSQPVTPFRKLVKHKSKVLQWGSARTQTEHEEWADRTFERLQTRIAEEKAKLKNSNLGCD